MNSSILTTPQWRAARKKAMHEFMSDEDDTRALRNIALGKRLMLAREALGYGHAKERGPRGRQKDFAINACIPTNTYNQYERGKNYPRIDYMEQLCKRYPGLTLEWIYRGSYDGMARDLSEQIQALLGAEAIPTAASIKKASRSSHPKMKVVEPRRRQRA